MPFRKILGITAFGLVAGFNTAQASLPSYAYVTGTFVAGSNYLEPLDAQGKFLHYHFKIQVAPGVLHEAVIDVKNGHLYAFPQRVMSINSPGLYGPVIGSANGKHTITMTANGGDPAQGALDFIRHPGILADLRTPWTYIKATPTANPNLYTLPQWDALFSGVQKIYVFGQPYTNGSQNGLHVVHQNQADKKSAFYASNAKFQDGAVIFEYANGVRKLLMTRFDDQPNDPGQSDFSWDYDPDGASPLKVGAGRLPTVVETECGGDSALWGFEQCTFGPFPASQIEAQTEAPGAYAVPAYIVPDDGGAMLAMAAPARNDESLPGIAELRMGASPSVAALKTKGYRRAYTAAAPGVTPSYYVYVPFPMNGSITKVTIRYVP